MKKLFISLGFILLVLVIFLLRNSELYYRIYLGDRIKGTVSIFVDGKQCDISESNIVFMKEGNVKIKDGKALVSMHAGEYGSYKYEIEGITDEPVRANFFQGNWWDIVRYDISISIDTKNKTAVYSGYIKSFDGTFDMNSTNPYEEVCLGFGFGP